MIRVVEVSTEKTYRHGIAALVNRTLSELSDVDAIEVVDIKYQTLALDVDGGYIIRTSALIIYKENTK